MRIAMIGTGYVGLVSGACFAELGHDVVCIDIDTDKIARLEDGDIPIFEPGLDRLVRDGVAAGRLTFSTNVVEGAGGRDAVFIAVGTPPRPDDGQADLKFVHAAAEGIAAAITGYTVVVDKSTVPVGTSRTVSEIIARTRDSDLFDVVSNPEFLREGAAIKDFLEPDRIVVGTESAIAEAVMRSIYQPLTDRGYPLITVTPESAELVKYAANAFLATKIAFINEIADLCEQVGADVLDVANGMGLDTRIGGRFLMPGPGYGGSCFPKDTLEMAGTARAAGSPSAIVEAVIAANDRRKKAMAAKLQQACGGSLDGRTVAVLGVTFKAGTDDMRESPALEIVPELQRLGASVRAYDPQGMEAAKKLLSGVDWADTAEAALTGADAAAIVTEWDLFRDIAPARFGALMKSPIVVDMRNLHDPAAMDDAGVRYHGIGRGRRIG